MKSILGKKKRRQRQEKVTGKNSPTFQVKRDKGTCVCTAFVLEKQGLVTFAFSFANFDKSDQFPVSQGGTNILMHQVKPI